VTKPVFRALDPFECNALLAVHSVGRLAFASQGNVDIEPIHFVWSDGWIYGRMGDGTKLRAIAANGRVAFEIDEVASLFDWRSVVVKGTVDLLAPVDEEPMHGEWQHAVALLRRIVPSAFTADDPVPERAVVFRIHAQQITGRAASTL
jgi:uncharacterized protein